MGVIVGTSGGVPVRAHKWPPKADRTRPRVCPVARPVGREGVVRKMCECFPGCEWCVDISRDVWV